MGGGIAQVLALGGARVALADVSAEVAQKNYERLLAESDEFVAAGLFPEGSTAILKENLWAAKDIEEAVADADFIEEAVPEVIAIKHQTLARISAAARPDAIIGSNTSTISIAELSEPVANPERFLGVHFSNPSPFIPGVEIIPHAGTSAATVGAVRDLVHAANKQTAVVKDVTGFVLNRLQYALFHEAAQLVEQEIATAEDIDTLVRTTFGFRLPFFGPFAIADMAGLDVYNFCYKSLQTRVPGTLRDAEDPQRPRGRREAGHQDRRRLPQRPGRAHAGTDRLPEQGVRGHAEAHRRARPRPHQLSPATFTPSGALP